MHALKYFPEHSENYACLYAKLYQLIYWNVGFNILIQYKFVWGTNPPVILYQTGRMINKYTYNYKS